MKLRVLPQQQIKKAYTGRDLMFKKKKKNSSGFVGAVINKSSLRVNVFVGTGLPSVAILASSWSASSCGKRTASLKHREPSGRFAQKHSRFWLT